MSPDQSGEPRTPTVARSADNVRSHGPKSRRSISRCVYIQDGVRFVRDHGSEWARRMSDQTSRYERIVRQVLADGLDEGTIRADIDVRLLAAHLFGLRNWPHRWFRPGEPFSPDEVASSISAVFLDGVATVNSAPAPLVNTEVDGSSARF